jgi:hypothetical protein
MSCTFCRSFRIILPALLALVVESGASFAGGPCGCLIDCNTKYQWARTWHGPNALATPLNQYFTPRVPGRCGSGSSYASWNECNRTGQYGAAYPPEAATGFEPVYFERLGQVPNELDLVGGMVGPASGVAPASRPAPSALLPAPLPTSPLTPPQ